MANTEVPLTIVSDQQGSSLSVVVIGGHRYTPPQITWNSYWFSVYDRYTLQQVYSYVQDANVNTVPADLSGKFNTDQYFLVMTTRSMGAFYLPSGPLFTFLVQHGAGTALKTLTQALLQIGCGSLDTLTYAMASMLGPGRPSQPRVEGSAIGATQPLILNATLLGVTVPQGTVYTPMPLTVPTP